MRLRLETPTRTQAGAFLFYTIQNQRHNVLIKAYTNVIINRGDAK